MAANPRNYGLYQDYVMIDLKGVGLDAALASAQRLMAEDQDFAELRALKGDVYQMANRLPDAVAAYTEANDNDSIQPADQPACGGAASLRAKRRGQQSACRVAGEAPG